MTIPIESFPYEYQDDQHKALLEQGVIFTTPKRSLLRFIGKPERTFLLRQPYLGTLYYLSKEWLRIDKFLDKRPENITSEANQLITKNALRYSRIIAIAYLNSYWKIKLFGGLLALYFSRRITPEHILGLTMVIDDLSNYEAFINTCRLMSASPSATIPARAESVVSTELTNYAI